MDLKPAFLFSRGNQSHGYGNLVLGSNNRHHHHPGDLPGGELAKVEMSWPKWTHRLLCMTSLAYCTIRRSSKCFLLLLSAMSLLMVPIFPSLTKAMTLDTGRCFRVQHLSAWRYSKFALSKRIQLGDWSCFEQEVHQGHSGILSTLNFSMSVSVKLNTLISKDIHFL